MKRRSLLMMLPPLMAVLLAAPVAAQPRQNLWVELRWVEQTLSAAAVAGVRDGAVVVGTGGSVSPRGQVVLGTRREDENQRQIQRLLVLNGSQASIQLGETVPVQWVDVGLQRQNGAQDRVYALPRQGVVERTQGFTLKPRWPGGRAPVTVEFSQQASEPATQAPPSGPPGTEARSQVQVASTVQVPLGQWVTVARSGAALQARERGTLSTRDAEQVHQRELQIRIDPAP